MKKIIVKKEYKISMCDECDYLNQFKTDSRGKYICEKMNKGVTFKLVDKDEEYGFGYCPIPNWCPFIEVGEMTIKEESKWQKLI